MVEEVTTFKPWRLVTIIGAATIVGCVMILSGWNSTDIIAVVSAIGGAGILLKSPVSSKEVPPE